jgi:hypothetical protein
LSKSKQVERYLNYMLDHPAMSTSFPLNVILKASQSGLESAKRIVLDQTKSKNCNQMNNGGSYLGDSSTTGNISTSNIEKIFSQSLFSQGTPLSTNQNLSWVRTAAQAALALRLHGILETTGCESASAKLQHASLPKFSNKGAFAAGGDEDAVTSPMSPRRELSEEGIEDDFEKGVVCIDDDDGCGYDMLPAPLPLPERSALCAGSVSPNTRQYSSSDASTIETHQGRVRYSDLTSEKETDIAVLGDVSVDKDIDRLRDMIRSVDVSLSKCLAASVVIGAARRERTGLHLDILKGIDSWEGMRGKIIAQRALLDGVESLENAYEISSKSSERFVSDFSWNSSLASSAVAAADEVRDAVKASLTASRAKHMADAAAKKASHFSNTTSFSSIDEAKAARTRASNLQSQAIHAAVIEHEAMTAKRRAAVALARDVKCWNVHRKRELLRTCFGIANQQRKAMQDSTNAWIKLRDGLLDSTSISSIFHNGPEIRSSSHEVKFQALDSLGNIIHDESIDDNQFLVNAVQSFTSADIDSELLSEIACYDQDAGSGAEKYSVAIGEEPQFDQLEGVGIADSGQLVLDLVHETAEEEHTTSSSGSTFHDTYEENVHPDQEVESEIDAYSECEPSSGHEANVDGSNCFSSSDGSSIVQATGDSVMGNSIGIVSPILDTTLEEASSDETLQTGADHPSLLNDTAAERSLVADLESSKGMTDSMQSLVDGLMTWGGEWDEEEDVTPLPQGMAASILEERTMMNLQC